MTVRLLVQATLNGATAIGGSLTEPTRVAELDDNELHQLIEDLRDTMWHHEICVGLAAPQIGDQRRVAVVNPIRKSRDEDIVLINPTILSVSGKKDTKRESCMSVWGMQGDVERRSRVEVRFTQTDGSSATHKYEGFIARVVQHEVDHLDGVLYVARLKSGSRLAAAEHFPALPA
jgi:peptide deformylase